MEHVDPVRRPSARSGSAQAKVCKLQESDLPHTAERLTGGLALVVIAVWIESWTSELGIACCNY